MSTAEEISRLADLHQRGALSDEEFARAKARILGTTPLRTEPALAAAINGLKRSRSDAWIGGVCGGLAQSTGLASWMWRLLFVLMMAFAGTGLLVYVLMWIFIPQE